MQKETEKKEYVSLPYFGLNKLLPYLKPYRGTILGMVILCLLAGVIDIIIPLFQRYALDHFGRARFYGRSAAFYWRLRPGTAGAGH